MVVRNVELIGQPEDLVGVVVLRRDLHGGDGDLHRPERDQPHLRVRPPFERGRPGFGQHPGRVRIRPVIGGSAGGDQAQGRAQPDTVVAAPPAFEPRRRGEGVLAAGRGHRELEQGLADMPGAGGDEFRCVQMGGDGDGPIGDGGRGAVIAGPRQDQACQMVAIDQEFGTVMVLEPPPRRPAPAQHRRELGGQPGVSVPGTGPQRTAGVELGGQVGEIPLGHGRTVDIDIECRMVDDDLVERAQQRRLRRRLQRIRHRPVDELGGIVDVQDLGQPGNHLDAVELTTSRFHQPQPLLAPTDEIGQHPPRQPAPMPPHRQTFTDTQRIERWRAHGHTSQSMGDTSRVSLIMAAVKVFCQL